MKLYKLLIWVVWFPWILSGQSARDVAVELYTEWQDGKGLKLQWKSDPNAKRYEIYKKSNDGKSWDLLDTVGSNVLSFLDSTLKKGMIREYRVAKWHTLYTSFAGNGYITAGYEVPYRPAGKVLVAIDSSYTKSLSKEIAEYLKQLELEGWQPITKAFLRSDSVTRVKAWLRNEYKKDTAGIKAILLLGRIPVPYSGNFRPDAHPEHTGAWPADLYYGSFSINWTDATINNTSAARSNNHNVPGDGKFDISRYNTAATLPSAIQKIELPVGRVDLYNMGGFSNNDTFLLARYLRKNLAFRRGEWKAVNRGLVDDNFGYFNSEAFASGGFRNFSVHAKDSVFERDYLTEMRKRSYLWSYGCGSGYYTGASGVANSSDFVADSLLNPFTLTFGSYYGDWDNADNFLRAPLASKGWGLASVWSGRPYWLMHSTALGEPLFSAVDKTYNSYPLYNVAAQFGGVHVALMGDPTLKVYPVPSLKNVIAKSTCSFELKSQVSWDETGADADSILVEILNSKGEWQAFSAVSASDTVVQFNFDTGSYVVSVRPKKLMQSASGTWWDLGARTIRKFVVNPLPQLGLVYSKTTYCLGDSITITENQFSKANKKQWQWAVGNKKLETTSSGKWVGRLDFAGRVDVFVTVVSDSGCSAAITDSFQVIQLPVVAIVGDTSLCLGMTAVYKFLNESKSYLRSTRWMYKGNSVGILDSVEITANAMGTFSLEIQVEDSWGCASTERLGVTVKELPKKPVISVVQEARFRGDTLILQASAQADSIIWNSLNNDLTVLRQDSVLSVIIPMGTNSYEVKLWATAWKDGCLSDTSLWSKSFEFNAIKDFSGLDFRCKPIGTGVYSVELSGDVEAKSLELYTITGVRLSTPILLDRVGEKWVAQIDLTPYAQGMVILQIKNQHGYPLGSKKLVY